MRGLRDVTRGGHLAGVARHSALPHVLHVTAAASSSAPASGGKALWGRRGQWSLVEPCGGAPPERPSWPHHQGCRVGMRLQGDIAHASPAAHFTMRGLLGGPAGHGGDVGWESASEEVPRGPRRALSCGRRGCVRPGTLPAPWAAAPSLGSTPHPVPAWQEVSASSPSLTGPLLGRQPPTLPLHTLPDSYFSGVAGAGFQRASHNGLAWAGSTAAACWLHLLRLSGRAHLLLWPQPRASVGGGEARGCPDGAGRTQLRHGRVRGLARGPHDLRGWEGSGK